MLAKQQVPAAGQIIVCLKKALVRKGTLFLLQGG